MNYKLLNVSHFPITKHFVKEVYVLENGEPTLVCLMEKLDSHQTNILRISNYISIFTIIKDETQIVLPT